VDVIRAGCRVGYDVGARDGGHGYFFPFLPGLAAFLDIPCEA
jgi:hypothetical protein